ncbi:hydrogenase 4 subunit F [Candidatus Uhrbacteria bacterium]|nr:hydrogenase 4 subunit F [Candidatus Uhrbacteria bacterium]
MLIYVLFGVLIFSGFAALIPNIKNNTLHRIGLSTAVTATVLTLWISGPVLLGTQESWQTFFWEVSRFGSLVACLIVFVYLGAMLVSQKYLTVEEKKGILSTNHVRLYMVCVPLFVLSMLVSIFANNAGIIWVALEATTLSTTLLVSFYRKKSSMEAAWKYIVLCSTGIALGLFGILMLGYAGSLAGLSEGEVFNMHLLRSAGSSLNQDIVKWAFVFLFVGFGTKVGFVPLHTWLPDAHSKTPAPVSAMLSGVLLNVAFFTLLRFKVITDTVLASSQWTNYFFLIFGTLSVILPAIILISQRNYKRMLAYSSVEHMGLLAFFVSLGPVGIVPFSIHMIGHTLAKSALFYGAGEFLQRFESTKFALVHATMARAPRTSTLFLLALLLLIAVPPSGLFLSEFMLVGLGFSQNPWLTAIVVLGLSLAGVGMIRSVLSLLFGEITPNEKQEIAQEHWNTTHTIMAIHIILGIAFGFWCLTGNGLLFLTQVSGSFFTL